MIGRRGFITGPVLVLTMASAWAGEISPVGASIEVQDMRCEVKSDYSIRCENIGRVCVAYRAQEEAERKKIFGCALESSPNHPCPPWSETTAKIEEKVKRFSHCAALMLGGF